MFVYQLQIDKTVTWDDILSDKKIMLVETHCSANAYL